VDQPTNQVEADLAAIWSDVFGFDQIGIHDDFSRLGGHSLQALQIVSKVRSSYQIGFTLREFFEAPTIAQLSTAVQRRIAAEIDSLTDEEARRLIAARDGTEHAVSDH
jgi:acyl carrier protein